MPFSTEFTSGTVIAIPNYCPKKDIIQVVYLKRVQMYLSLFQKQVLKQFINKKVKNKDKIKTYYLGTYHFYIH